MTQTPPISPSDPPLRSDPLSLWERARVRVRSSARAPARAPNRYARAPYRHSRAQRGNLDPSLVPHASPTPNVVPHPQPTYPPLTMRRPNAWFLAIIAALIAAAALAITTDRATADEPAGALLETQIAGDIESAERQTTPLQWGGGSLYRLKMRLATKGCILDLVWAYDTPSRTWYFYNQYHIPYSFNESFLKRFGTFIPAGTIWVQCFDRCEFSDDGSYANPDTGRAPSGEKDCVSFWEFALWSDGTTGYTRFQELEHRCTYDFHSILKEKLFPILPIIPGLCIIRSDGGGGGSGLYIGTSSHHGVEAFYDPSGFSNRNLFARWQYYIDVAVNSQTLNNFSSRSPEAFMVNWNIATEVHEICHAFEDWNVWQMVPSADRIDSSSDYYRNNRYTFAFDEAVGFEKDEVGLYILPKDHIYNDVYGGNGGELFAELCMLYAFEKMELPNAMYSIGYPDSNYTYDDYLTPKIRAFFDEWVFLPHP